MKDTFFRIWAVTSSLLASLLLAGVSCSQPQPPAPPIDPAPAPAPTPGPTTKPLPHAAVMTVKAGMSRASLVATLGREPDGDRDMRDGTRMLRWPAINSVGEPIWLDVQIENNVVLGYFPAKRAP